MRCFYLILVVMLFGCKSQKLSLTTVSELDLNAYSGTWYEIARLPNSFEKGLKCITANYKLNDDGSVRVLNSAYSISDPTKQSSALGKAKLPDINEPGKLKVAFQWPFYGKYWVLKLDEGYTYSVVGTPSGKYLWILSRTPQMDDKIYNQLVNFCKSLGYETEKLIVVDHTCH